MKKIWHIFRLIRPLNIAVIALTMTVFQKFISRCSISDLFQIDFILLILSTALIASAGNIINDYFDVKADRINKPELLIIDKYIKRRWAILFNWIFNSLGFLIAIYLGWKYQNWLIPIISFSSINLLWFYSMYFKRTFILGNLIVALLTGIVPLYVLTFNTNYSPIILSHVLLFSGFAFGINFIREIVKDVADIKGDLLLGSKTIPIKMGIDNTRYMIYILFTLLLVGMGNVLWILALFIPEMIEYEKSVLLAFACVLFSMIFTVGAVFFLPKFPNRKKYLIASKLLKLAMFFGLLTPLFL